MHKKNKRGFTLTELIIVITLFSFLLLFTIPLGINQLQGNDTESSARQLQNYLFEAQQNAYSRKDRSSGIDKCYGISFANTGSKKYDIFYADWNSNTSSCGTRTITQASFVGNSTVTTGLIEVYFIPGSFRPNTSGSIDIINNNSKYTVYVTSEGSLYYKKIQ